MQSVVACKVLRIFYTILTKGVRYYPEKLLGDIKKPQVQARNSGNKNRQYPVRVGLNLRQTVLEAESSHVRKDWEACGTGWGNVHREVSAREAYRSVRLIQRMNR